MTNKLEMEIQKEITDWLNYVRVPHWRISASNMSNFPDLLILYKGRFIAFELKKNAKAEFREGQKKKLRFLREHGAIADVAWDLEHIQEIMGFVSVNKLDKVKEKYKYKGD